MAKIRRSGGATMSLSAEILDTLTPAGRGKRIDATFTNGTGTKKRRITVLMKPKKPARKP